MNRTRPGRGLVVRSGWNRQRTSEPSTRRLRNEPLRVENPRSGPRLPQLTFNRWKSSLFMLALPALLLVLPNQTQASSAAGYRYYQTGRYTDALVEYEAALKEVEDPRLHFNLAAAAYQAGQFDRAHSHFLASVTSPDVGLQQKAYYNLGNTQFRMGEAMTDFVSRQTQWEEAAKSFRNALTLQTNDVDAVFNLRFVEGKLAEMKEWLRRRDESRREAEVAQRRHDYRRALQIMEELKARNPAAQTKDIETYIERLKQIDQIAPGKTGP